MLSVVIVLAMLGLGGALVARAARSLDAASVRVGAVPADTADRERRDLHLGLEELHAALDRSGHAGRSER